MGGLCLWQGAHWYLATLPLSWPSCFSSASVVLNLPCDLLKPQAPLRYMTGGERGRTEEPPCSPALSPPVSVYLHASPQACSCCLCPRLRLSPAFYSDLISWVSGTGVTSHPLFLWSLLVCWRPHYPLLSLPRLYFPSYLSFWSELLVTFICILSLPQFSCSLSRPPPQVTWLPLGSDPGHFTADPQELPFTIGPHRPCLPTSAPWSQVYVVNLHLQQGCVLQIFRLSYLSCWYQRPETILRWPRCPRKWNTWSESCSQGHLPHVLPFKSLGTLKAEPVLVRETRKAAGIWSTQHDCLWRLRAGCWMCGAVSEGCGPAVGCAVLSLKAGGRLLDVRCCLWRLGGGCWMCGAVSEGWGSAVGCAVLLAPLLGPAPSSLPLAVIVPVATAIL